MLTIAIQLLLIMIYIPSVLPMDLRIILNRRPLVGHLIINKDRVDPHFKMDLPLNNTISISTISTINIIRSVI